MLFLERKRAGYFDRILERAKILSREFFSLEIMLGFLKPIDDLRLKCCILDENLKNSISGRKCEIFRQRLLGQI